MPIEPPPTDWELPDPRLADEHGVVGLGADLEPGTILAGYRQGLFPMRIARGGPVAWWSPDPRAVLPLDALRVSTSLRRSCRRFEIRVDTAFSDVIRACADPARPDGWIDATFVVAYETLHRLGWAHSVETWCDGQLVGGLYGVAIGGLFAGESMFHRASDASKVALVALVERLLAAGASLLDVQWITEHLRSLGAIEISRERYLALLEEAIDLPVDAFA
ncbi:MAG: leucyl/phenylalanyl-tRNA--protein transferase [Acidimicrobiia bacterium]